MARLREFDADTALDAVKSVFWRRGFEGASYADLIRETGLGKGSLYAAFGDKKALYLRALKAYIASEVEAAAALLRTGPENGSAPARVRAFLDLAIDPAANRKDRRGCFLCNAAVDLAPEDANVEAVVLDGMDRLRAALRTALADHVEAPALPGAAEQFLTAYFGLRVMAKGGATAAQLEAARDAALAVLDRAGDA